MTIHRKMHAVKISEVLVGRFARNVKKIREKRGWSHEELAVKAGITQPYVSMLESGQRAPSLAMVAQLAEAFGVDPSELLKEVRA